MPKKRKPRKSKKEFQQEIRDDYHTYLHSKGWERKSAICVRMAKKKCEICGETKRLQAHHYNYTNLKYEKHFDLFCLCEHCHRLYHANTSKLPDDSITNRSLRLIHLIETVTGKKISI